MEKRSSRVFEFHHFVFSYVILSLYALAPKESREIFAFKNGSGLAENRLSPYIDHYSFTNYGDAVSPVPVIF